jgi:hypothetical protein
MIVYTVIYVVILYYMACSFTAAQTLTPGKWLYHIITTVYIYIYMTVYTVIFVVIIWFAVSLRP